ncbi:hypothetical protein [Mucilaginibacter sp. dw_454]|uniref:hypothetical protein n=1 Tax=Mucilaginibacter sp. dw_454 TaxID=2720079 RepID=UPI001BD5C734|nr:hypothetical protein [Mucilaginibacter sp. dw_454]
MEAKYSTITTIITICLIVITGAMILTMGHDDSIKRNIYEGVLMLACLFAFTAFVITRESADDKL